jgi:patatin-like phospholipase/acyl hydrolase
MKPFFILTCDGGGVRGKATASFLNKMEQHMKTIQPDFSLYNKFDMFAGTSIGSFLITLILQKKTASEINELFNRELCETMMDKSFWDERLGIMQHKPKYDGKGKTDVITNYFGDTTLASIKDKHVIVPTYNITKRKTNVFYSHTCHPDTLLSEILDASSAAPGYFPCVKIQNSHSPQQKHPESDWFVDGGMVANNPTLCAISHAYNLLCDSGRKIVVINVGTGYQTRPICGKDAKDYGGVEWLMNDILGIAMDETIVHEHVSLLLRNHSYVNVNSELIGISDDLDDYDDDNFNKLEQLGEQWWETHKDEITQMLSE